LDSNPSENLLPFSKIDKSVILAKSSISEAIQLNSPKVQSKPCTSKQAELQEANIKETERASQNFLNSIDENFLKEYEDYLDREREEHVNKRQHAERLGQSIQSYMIEDAKVLFD
jgi:hypothetical protein